MKHSQATPFAKKVDCIRLYVEDLNSGLTFYRNRLGHDIIWKTENAVGLRMSGTDTEIVLHTEPKALEIDLKVDSVDEAVIRFENAGGRILVPPFDIQIGRCAVVHDPWGNELVLVDTTKGLLVTDEEGDVIGNRNP